MPKRATRKDLDKLIALYPHFQNVEDATGVPKEAMAAILYRENSGNTTNPRRKGGPFQFDPPPPVKTQRMLLNKYSNLSEKEKDAIIAGGVDKFESGVFLSACFLRHKCKPVITPNSPDSHILDMFWGYNGRAGYHKGDPKNSFYVYNGYDDAHDGLMVRGTVPDIHNPKVRIRIDRPETRPGAFVVYKQLKGELQ